MNKLFQVLLMSVLYSCNNIEHKNLPVDHKSKSDNLAINDQGLNEVYDINPEALTKDFMTWYDYTYSRIHLSQDFIGLGIDSLEIDKLTFLKRLQSGNQTAFKIKMLQGKPVYRLYHLGSKDESIIATIKQMASTEMAHVKMEGTYLPDFNFIDLNGNNYNKSTTKGKLLVLKCWFIHCVACVKEFPQLNKLVDENKDVPDLLFVSLAMDSKQDLQNFLRKKEFKYAVVPNTKNYMIDKLEISEYPTHLLVNRKGKIIKVVNRIEDLVPFLNIEKSKI